MAKTEFLGLNLTEDDPLFEDWRKSLDGNNPEGQESNMQIIDKAMEDLSKNGGSGKSTIILTPASTPEDIENAHREVLAGNLDIVVYDASIYRLVYVTSYEMYFDQYTPNISPVADDPDYQMLWDSFASYIRFFKDDTGIWQADWGEVFTPGFVFGTSEDSEEYLLKYFEAAQNGLSHVLLETQEGYVWFNLSWEKTSDSLDMQYLNGSTAMELYFGDSSLWLRYDHAIDMTRYDSGECAFYYSVSIYPTNGSITIYEDGDLEDLNILVRYLLDKHHSYMGNVDSVDINLQPFYPYIQLETSNGRLPAIRVEDEVNLVFYNETTGEHYMAVMEDDGYTLVYWQDESGSGSGSGTTNRPQTFPLTVAEDADLSSMNSNGEYFCEIVGYDGFSWKEYRLKLGETVNLVKFFSGGSVATSSAGIFAGMYVADRLNEIYREYGCVIELIGPMVITGEQFQE